MYLYDVQGTGTQRYVIGGYFPHLLTLVIMVDGIPGTIFWSPSTLTVMVNTSGIIHGWGKIHEMYVKRVTEGSRWDTPSLRIGSSLDIGRTPDHPSLFTLSMRITLSNSLVVKILSITDFSFGISQFCTSCVVFKTFISNIRVYSVI